MHLINFINSIKNSFIYKSRVIPEEQKGQTFHHKKLPDFEGTTLRNAAEYLQREEKESVITRHTLINNSEGTPTPLTVRIPPYALKKKEDAGKKKHDADSHTFLFDLIIETENLGPVLLRLEGESRLYYCSLYAKSEEIATFLCEDFEEIRLLLDGFLQKTRLAVNFLSWSIFSPEEKESLKSSLKKEHFSLDTRV